MVCFTPQAFLLVYLCMNVGPQGLPATSLWGLLAAAWPSPFHNRPRHWVRQPPPCLESSLPRLPFSAPPSSLDECFFFISLVVRLPHSSIFCQFWLVFVFKLLSFFWLCKEPQCVYLCLHLGWKPYSFSNFQAHNTVLLLLLAMTATLYVGASGLTHNWKFVPIDHHLPNSPSPKSWQPPIYLDSTCT